MKKSRMVVWAVVAAVAMAASATDYSYTSAQTVSEVLADGGTPSTLTVNGTMTYNEFVSLTGNNTFTGGTTLQKGNISVDSVNALGPSGAIHCASGTTVRVTVSFRDAGTTLNAAILDRLVVDPPAGGGEPWVAIKLDGDGLRNDVDFTDQPYLWLCKTCDNTSTKNNILVGIFTPCSDNYYRFGYAGSVNNNGASGICVTNLVDAPNGDPRHVLCRGKGCTMFRYGEDDKGTAASKVKITYSGRMIVEDNHRIASRRVEDFGRYTRPEYAENKITLGDGCWWHYGAYGHTFPALAGLKCEGNVTSYFSGNNGVSVWVSFLGNFSGSGTFKFQDLGGAGFYGTNNTYSGKIDLYGTYSGVQHILIGNGANFSWGGADIEITYNNTAKGVILNSDHDATYTGAFIGNKGDSLVKRGAGTITLTQPYNRVPANNVPPLVIEGGTLRRGVEETTPMTGKISIAKGACFDLNRIPASQVYIPYGGGSIVNPADGAMTFEGTAPTNAFSGTLDGAVTMRLTDGQPFLFETPAEVTGPLTVEQGAVSFGESVYVTGGVHVAEFGTVAFGSTNLSHVLPAEFFLNKMSLVQSTSTVPLADQFMYFATNKTPNLTLDTTAFTTSEISGGTFQSYKFTSDAARSTLPYEQMVGGVDKYEWFGIRFSGCFLAETAGTYSFRGKADDKLALYLDDEPVFLAQSSYVGGTKELTAGYHKFTLIFIDMSCDEYFWFEMKAPGETSWRGVPVALLSPVPGPSQFGPVTGTGRISLAEDGSWPATDFSGFTGLVNVDERTADEASGKLALGTATIDFARPWECGGDNWNMCGNANAQVCLTNLDRQVAYRLTPGALGQGAAGSLNSTKKVSLTKPWKFSFDYQMVRPWYNIGDGFFFGLHDDGKDAVIDSWNFSRSGRGSGTGYGMQLYIMSASTPIDWVNGQAGNRSVWSCPVTNKTWLVGNKMANGEVLHVEMVHNCGPETGTNLVVTLSMGDNTFVTTNEAARTQLATKYTSGEAYLGIWAKDGAFYCGKIFSNVMFDDGTPEPEKGFNGVLGLADGTVTLRGNTITNATVSAALDVTGAATLTAERFAKITSDEWSFGLNGVLTLAGGLVLDVETVTVDPERPAEGGRRLLADFTALGLGTDDYPKFELATGVKGRLELVNGKLYVNHSIGTAIIFR